MNAQQKELVAEINAKLLGRTWGVLIDFVIEYLIMRWSFILTTVLILTLMSCSGDKGLSLGQEDDRPKIVEQNTSIDTVVQHTSVDTIEAKRVVLQGTLFVGEFLGPPNYGESPEIDRIERIYYLQVPVLLFEQLIYLNGYKPEDVGIMDGRLKGSFIQLINTDSKTDLLEDKVGQKIEISGNIWEAETGHHYLPVMMTVRKVKVIEAWDW